MMAETRMVKRQEEFLKTVRRGQEFMLGAIKTWAEAVHPITPKLPLVHLPLADKLPKPKDVVENTYDFAEKLLANQRKFAEEVLKAAAPLAPVKSNGTAAKARPASK
jgi:hypothetical protein